MRTQKQRYNDTIIFWVTCTGYLLFVFFLISAYTPLKILHTRYASKGIAATFFPVRWNVYTRTPGEPLYKLYLLQDGRAVQYDIRPFSGKFAFGLKRDSKILAAEMTEIMQDTIALAHMNKVEVVMHSSDDINRYIKVDTVVYNEYVSDNVLYLKGKYIVTKEQSLTWDQARTEQDLIRTVLIVPVNIMQKR